MNKRRKLNTTGGFQKIEGLAEPCDEHSNTEDLSKAITVKSSVTSTGHIEVDKGVDLLSSNPLPELKPAGSKYKRKKGYSFARILSSPISYVVLWKNSNILQKFINEGARLIGKNDAELEELRMIIFHRKLDAVNLGKYPDGALRVFFFLLRNQEAPPFFGREELLEFCSEWNCKRKYYWCFSEVQRQRHLAASMSTFQHGRVGDPGSIIEDVNVATESENVRAGITGFAVNSTELLDVGTSNAAENSYPEPKETVDKYTLDELSDSLSQATYNTLFGEDIPSAVQEDRCSAGVDALQCTSTLTDREFQNNDFSSEIRDNPAQVVDGERTAHKLMDESTEGTGLLNHIMGQPNHLQVEYAQAIQDPENLATSFFREQGAATQPGTLTAYEDPAHPAGNCEISMPHELQEMMISERASVPRSLLPYPSHVLHAENKSSLVTAFQSDPCLCDSCTMDPTFCYGCQCCLCKAEISLKQNWSFLHCTGCNHVCHLECALKERRAGVITEMGLDGELLCPSCLRKRDLIPFWKERVNNASMSADISVIEKQLFSAVLVLNGTQRELYQSIHDKLKELHSSVLYDRNCPELIECLQQIKKEVDSLDDLNEQTSDFEEISEELLRSFQGGDLLTEESKVLELKKKSELDNAEWLQAEDSASIQRLKLKETMEEVKKAEEEAKLKADCARASKRHLQRGERRLQFLKNYCRSRVVSNEQIDIQKAALNTELSELNKLQTKLGSFSYDSPGLSVTDFSLLLESLKVQRKRVESAQSMLDHLIGLDNILK